MKKGRFTEEQIIGVLKQHEAGRKVPELAREIGVSEATIYTWKSKYGGMDVSDAQKLKSLEDQNPRRELPVEGPAKGGLVPANGRRQRTKRPLSLTGYLAERSSPASVRFAAQGQRALPAPGVL